MKTRHIVLTAMIFASSFLFAQKSEFGVNYKIGMPAGNFKDFSDAASFLGIDFKIDYKVNDNLFVGLKVGGQTFYSYSDRKYYYGQSSMGDYTISATRTAYTIMYPLMVHGFYEFPLDNPKFIPYGGLGIGMNFILSGWYYGDIEMDWVNNTAFAISPEAGLKIGLNQDNSILLNIGVNWDYSFYDQMDVKNISVLNVFAGFAFKY